MPINPFRSNEESSFERGISVQKPVKVLDDAAKQQAKSLTNDIVAQLYGVTDKSTSDPSADPNAKNPAQSKPSPAPPPLPNLSGTSNVGDHSKYLARQQYLNKGDAKGAENAMFHMQHYFDETVMTLEDRVKKVRQEMEQKKQEEKKQEEQEEEQKKQAEAQEREELPQVSGKGRNRMGMPPNKKPKTPMSVQMGKNKAEMFRGASG